MGYVGRGLNQDGGQYRKLDSIATSFNGSETNFTLTIDGLEVTPTAQNLMISLGGVIQEPGTAFTVNGSTITFASAPADATTFFGVLMGEATFIARGTVGAAEMGITAGAVSASAGVVVDSSKNVIGFNEISASIFKGSFSGDTSSSINTRINNLVTNSGSFSTRTTTLESASGSLSTRVTTNESDLTTLKGGGTLQSVATNASPTFVGATITGTLTAQEIHTEFESASIIFSSGSTIFGDTSNDIHRMTGSLNVSGAINLNNGDLTMGANITMADDTSIGISDSAERIEFDGAGDISFLGANVGIGTNNPTKLLDIESSGTEASMDFTNDARTYRIGINDFGTGDDRLFFTDVTEDATRLSIKADGTIHSHNSAIHITTDGTDDGDYNGAVLSRGVLSLNRDDTATVKQIKFHKNGSEHSSLETTSDGFNISGSKVGIGTRVPLAKMHVEHTTDDTDENGNIALTVGGGASGAVRHYWGINNSSNYAYYGAVEHATQYVPLVLQPNGSNVGIGSTSPGANLDVGHATDSRIRMTRTDSTVVADESLGSIQFAADDPSAGAVGASIQSKASSAWSSNNYGAYIRFLTTPDNSGDQAERMRITEDGYVGIGTDNPGMQLQIRGSGTQQARIYSTDGVGRFVIRGATQGDLFLHDESGGTNLKQVQLVQVDDLFKIRQITDAGGLGRENLLVIMPEANNVGIGTATPTIGSGRGLHIRAPEANLHAGIRLDTPSGGDWSIIAVDNDDRLLFYDNENSQYGLAIDENAHVGIGLTSPNVRLHVRKSGNGKAGNIARFAQENDSDSVLMYGRGTGAYGASSADTCLAVATMETTGRSINAGGTINASGADYAEYETKRDDCGTIEKGDIVGFDTNGLITDKWTNAVTFGIKSTNPSYVGGDTWGVGVSSGSIETERQKVDRIAYSGKVPCNVTGSSVGDYIIPVQVGDGIGGVAKSSPTYDEYKQSVGVVRTISGSLPIVVVKTL